MESHEEETGTSELLSLPPELLANIASHLVPLRLRKYLSLYTCMSNKDIDTAFKSNRIKVLRRWSEENVSNGSQTFAQDDGLTALVFPGQDTVLLDDHEIEPVALQRTYIAFHKPMGVISAAATSEISNKDSKTTAKYKNEKNLDPWLSKLPEGVVPIGRLDRDTTGLLLLTNDGDLNHCIRKKNNSVVKEYELTLEGDNILLSDTRLQQLLNGVQLTDGLACAMSIKIVDPHVTFPIKAQGRTVKEISCTKIRVEVKEGRFHIIRRLCAAVSLTLLHLHRVRIGNIVLNDAIGSEGNLRELSTQEVEDLWVQAGGKEQVKLFRILALLNIAQKCAQLPQPHLQQLLHWLSKHKLMEYCSDNTVLKQ